MWRLFRAGALVATLSCAVAACNFGTTIDQHPCPPSGTKLTYMNFGAAFFDRYCNSCHSAPESSRQGAPGTFVFGTLDQVRSHEDRIFVRAAANNDSMPPGPDDTPDTARAQLADWLACGAP